MEINALKSEQRRALLRDKFGDKSYSDTWGGLRSAITPVSFIIQLATAALAVGLPAYAVKVITGSWFFGFIVGVVIIFGFEYVKRLMVHNTALTYYRNLIKMNPKRLTFGGILAVAVIVGMSIASSALSVPILVKEFAPMPEKPSADAISAKYDSLRDQSTAHWQSFRSTALAKANEVHKQNNWKGVTVRAARSTKLKFERQASSSMDSLNSALAVIANQELTAQSNAQKEYSDKVLKRQQEKNLIGPGLALATLFLELIFILCYTWLNYYDYRQAVEMDLVAEQSPKQSSPKVPTNTDFTKQSPKEVAIPEPHQRGGIGFNQEGRIVKEGGKFKILCQTQKGLKAYDSSYLGTLLRDAEKKGQPKAEYWRDMKYQLEQAKA